MKGVFKVHPYERSVFHFTDHSKQKDICIRYEDYDFSGPISLTNIETGNDLSVRLRNQVD